MRKSSASTLSLPIRDSEVARTEPGEQRLVREAGCLHPGWQAAGKGADQGTCKVSAEASGLGGSCLDETVL